MKKSINLFSFVTLALGGAALAYSSVIGVFQNFGVGTELFMLCTGFASAVLGGYAVGKELAS